MARISFWERKRGGEKKMGKKSDNRSGQREWVEKIWIIIPIKTWIDFLPFSKLIVPLW